MIRGRFGDTTGRPYIEGRLIVPRLNLRSDVSFIVDTGADNSLLMPLDGMRMGIDYAGLSGDAESVGIGGISRNFVEPAIIVFSEPRHNLFVYMIQLQICSPFPDILNIPSLLGRDILDRWRMTYNPSKRYLAFKVLSADYTVPIAPTQLT